MAFCHSDTRIVIYFFFFLDKEIACSQENINLEGTEIRRNNGKHDWCHGLTDYGVFSWGRVRQL